MENKEYIKSLKERLSNNIKDKKDYLDSKYIEKQRLLSSIRKILNSEYIDSIVSSEEDLDENYISLISEIFDVYLFSDIDSVVNMEQEDFMNTLKSIDILLTDFDAYNYNNSEILRDPEKVKFYTNLFFKDGEYHISNYEFDPETLELKRKQNG